MRASVERTFAEDKPVPFKVYDNRATTRDKESVRTAPRTVEPEHKIQEPGWFRTPASQWRKPEPSPELARENTRTQSRTSARADGALWEKIERIDEKAARVVHLMERGGAARNGVNEMWKLAKERDTALGRISAEGQKPREDRSSEYNRSLDKARGDRETPADYGRRDLARQTRDTPVRETLKEMFHRQVATAREWVRGRTAEREAPEKVRESARETFQKEFTAFKARLHELNTGRDAGIQAKGEVTRDKMEPAGRWFETNNRAAARMVREPASSSRETAPDRTRESVQAMYARQIREPRDRTQERATGRGR